MNRATREAQGLTRPDFDGLPVYRPGQYTGDPVQSLLVGIVHFTPQGHAAWARIHEILAEIESEWRDTLGNDDFNRLKALLCEVWESDLIP